MYVYTYYIYILHETRKWVVKKETASKIFSNLARSPRATNLFLECSINPTESYQIPKSDPEDQAKFYVAFS